MRHMILLSSSYSTFERIGYHIAFDENFEANYNLFKEKAKEIGATYQYSPYVYTADDWMNEIRTNLFYENVRIIDDLDEFISLIEKGLKINALNVAHYILANQTHSPDSAWSKCYKEGQKNTIIPDDVIVKCLY